MASGGFGLNFDHGFGSGKSFVGQQWDPVLNQINAQAYQQRLGGQQQFEQDKALQQPKLDLQRYQTDTGNALQRELANQQGQTQRYVADTQGQTQLGVASTNAGAQRYQADVNAQSQKYGIDTNALLQRDLTSTQTQAQRDIAAGNQATQRYGVDVGSQTQLGIAGQQNALQRYLGDQSNTTQRYGIDTNASQRQREAELQAQTQLSGFGSQEKIAGINAQAAALAPTLQQQRFNQVFPFLTQALDASGASGGGIAGGGNQPFISTAPVLNQNQIQQQVNAQRANNDQSTAGKVQDMRNQLAGRGFGSNSPLSMLLGGNLQMQNLATNTGNERDTRINAAQQNAQQVLSAQQAREQQYASRQQEGIQRQQVGTSARNAILAALAGLA